jgi:L-ribulokinase
MSERIALGIDFGTESVRAILVDPSDGRVLASASQSYAHGVLDTTLPTGERLPVDYAFQHPRDWLDDTARAIRSALDLAGIAREQIASIGVDFTSCTMLPAKRDGTPLCLVPGLEREPFAWPKLWKHHGAKDEVDRINQVARERNEAFLARYGGNIGIEWFFPKMLETLHKAPAIYDATEVWLEAGDWFVWQLVSGPFPDCSPDDLPRSTCQAGYKACWNAETGYPSREYLNAVDPKFGDVVQSKMPGRIVAPGQRAGSLTKRAADRLGLPAGVPVSAAIIDAHAGVPGAGVAGADTLVMVLGTSSCHMLNSRVEQLAPGVAGVVRDGILPGLVGYETGQSSVGDAFAWVSRITGKSHDDLNRAALALSPGSGGVLALDWLNGCRTPLMDARLSGAVVGLTLTTRPEQLYRAMIEATAMGVKWIVQTLRDGGVPVSALVAAGGLPKKSPLLMQIYADVLALPIDVAGSDEPVALGAAILGASAAGIGSIDTLIQQMTPPPSTRYTPDPQSVAQYAKLDAQYRALTQPAGDLARAMRALRQLG